MKKLMLALALVILAAGALTALSAPPPVQAAFENIYDDADLTYGPMDSFSNWTVIPDAGAQNGAFHQATQAGSYYTFTYYGNAFTLSYYLPSGKSPSASGGCLALVTVRHDASLTRGGCIQAAGDFYTFHDAVVGTHTTTVTLVSGVLNVDWVGIQGYLR